MLIRRVDTEVMVGLISVRIPSQRILGREAMRGLLIKMAIINSSNEIRKAKREDGIGRNGPASNQIAFGNR
jgi:hypothetical protein